MVTDDGRRPWHQRFQAVKIEQGLVACWWGQRPLRLLAAREYWRLNILLRKAHDHGRGALAAHVRRLMSLIGGTKRWPELFPDASPHPGDCDIDGFIGVAYLPQPPDCWRPDAVWPGWRHLAHAHEGEAAMERAWAEVSADPLRFLETRELLWVREFPGQTREAL